MYRDTIPGLAIVPDHKQTPVKKPSMVDGENGLKHAAFDEDFDFGDLGKVFDLSRLSLSQVPDECKEEKEPRGFH